MNQEVFGASASLLSALTWAIGASQYETLAKNQPTLVIALSRALMITPLFVLASLAHSYSAYGSVWQELAQLDVHAITLLVLAMMTRVGIADPTFIWATRHIGATLTIAISSSYPLFAAILGYFFRHEILAPMQIFGLCAVVSGVVLVTLSARQQELDNKQSYGRGVLFALITALMWAIGSLAVRNAAVASGTANLVRSLSSLPMILVMSQLGRRPIGLLNVQDFRRYAPAFLFEGFLASYCGMLGLLYCPLGIATALGSLAPIFALPIALWRGEKLAMRQILGSCMVGAGSVALALGS